MKIKKNFLANLKAMLINLEAVRTVDGKDLMVDGDIEVGKDIMIADENGEYEPAPSGEYDTGDTTLVVEAGRINEIRENKPEETEPETPEAPAEETEAAEVEVVEEEVPVDTDALLAEIASLQDENAGLRDRVAELEAENAALREKQTLAAVPPVGEGEGKTELPLMGRLIDASRRRQ